ncbi:MAG: hypothetical protein JXR76_25765 [Deltaproteobacteria bacterium]|nr:hypothetical protein [Deltaproteobacteria bacterium]
MRIGVLCGLLLILWVLAFGCEREQEISSEVDSETVAPANVTRKAPPMPAAKDTDSKVATHDVSVLAHGNHMVFGIRIPKGMIPIEAGDKVKRFEGTHSIESVKRYIEKQLAGRVDVRHNKFGEGYFFASAVPASSQRDPGNVDTLSKKYNIKIFEGSLGGASLDIWEALPGQEVVDIFTSSGTSTMGNILGKRDLSRNQNAQRPKVKFQTRKQRDKATFDVIEKMSKGQRLTDQDYQSPYFTEI